MAKPGPEEEKGSRILKRVKSLMNLDFLTLTPTPAPAAAASSTVANQNEEKEKKEKKSKKEKNSKKEKSNKGSKKEEKEIQEQKAEKKDDETNRGSIRYITHDKKPIYAADLRRLSVTVCTYEERAEQKAKEKADRDASLNRPTSRLPTLQDLFAEPTPTNSNTPSVRKGSVIENLQQVTSDLEKAKISDQPPPPTSNPPVLHRTPSIVFNHPEGQTPSLPKKSKKKSSAPKPP